MKERDRPGRGRGGAERLQIILVGVGGKADDGRDKAAAELADRVADRDADALGVPAVRNGVDLDNRPREPVLA